MKTEKLGAALLGIALGGIGLACDGAQPTAAVRSAHSGFSANMSETRAAQVRWDLPNVFAGGIDPGGHASAKAQDGARITVTGTGTFTAPAGGDGTSSAVTGGGTWSVAGTAATPSGSGTFHVTGLVRWDEAPGALPPTANDRIGHVNDARAGVVVLRIEYSDGSRGILSVNCRLGGTPASVSEGITATKGFFGFWDHEEPTAGVEGNRTLFHVVRDAGR